MNDLFFRLVCVDESNMLEYEILEDVNIGTIDDVHKFVKNHLGKHLNKNSKWMLIPVKRSNIEIGN